MLACSIDILCQTTFYVFLTTFTSTGSCVYTLVCFLRYRPCGFYFTNSVIMTLDGVPYVWILILVCRCKLKLSVKKVQIRTRISFILGRVPPDRPDKFTEELTTQYNTRPCYQRYRYTIGFDFIHLAYVCVYTLHFHSFSRPFIFC